MLDNDFLSEMDGLARIGRANRRNRDDMEFAETNDVDLVQAFSAQSVRGLPSDFED